jgi:hypothetical protein
MNIDDLSFAANTRDGNKRDLSDGQLIAAALFKVAEAIEDVGNKLARYLPDCPDAINDNVASALNNIAEAIDKDRNA